LLAAFAPHSGQAIAISSPNKTGETVLSFLQDVVLPRFAINCKVYLVWDNFSAHKRARKRATAPANVEFFWTPTNASWLNLIEPEKTALYNTDLKTTEAIAENLRQGIDYLNSHPRPYRWTKAL
jgi:transposase